MFKYGFGRIICGCCSASIAVRVDKFKNDNNEQACIQKDECDHFKFEIELKLFKPDPNEKHKSQKEFMEINLKSICKECGDDFDCFSTCTSQSSRSGIKVVSGHGVSCFFAYEYTSNEDSDFINRPIRGNPNMPLPKIPNPVPYQLNQLSFLDFYSRGPSPSCILKQRV
ncbi:hypothetical protein BpHYR1_002497 [Brachionus plicatilis]|uniref:Uncharacterized protein n=1 Tax=Brachionus plicatilis TaxID=10195 RepID=A0A3M7QS98_BRAPC|nr:hypothetical protein BpHYR1_002497 [Brachionus plicatilis]